MNTATAYTAYNRYVSKIVKSRIRNCDTAADVVQSAWMSIHQATIPDDLTESKRIVRTIAIRSVVSHIRSTLGRTGKRSRINSGIVTGDTAEFVIDQATDSEWLSSYPENLRYLASHLASGGSARELYASHGRYRVVQDFGALKEFCAEFCVQN